MASRGLLSSAIVASVLVLVFTLLLNQLLVRAETSSMAAQTVSLETSLAPREKQVISSLRSRSLLQTWGKGGMHKGKGMHKVRPGGSKPGHHVERGYNGGTNKAAVGGAWDLRDLNNGPLRVVTDPKLARSLPDGTALLALKPGHTVGGKLRSVNRYQYGRFEFSAMTPKKNSGGIISTVYLSTMSGRHDEIDFEFKRSGVLTKLQTNWFACDVGGHEFEPQIWFKAYEAFHDYAIDWQPNRINFIVDGKIVQTVYPTNGKCFPQEPMYLQVAVWHASWAGPVDWSYGSDYEFAIKNVVVKPVKTFIN